MQITYLFYCPPLQAPLIKPIHFYTFLHLQKTPKIPFPSAVSCSKSSKTQNDNMSKQTGNWRDWRESSTTVWVTSFPSWHLFFCLKTTSVVQLQSVNKWWRDTVDISLHHLGLSATKLHGEIHGDVNHYKCIKFIYSSCLTFWRNTSDCAAFSGLFSAHNNGVSKVKCSKRKFINNKIQFI